MATKVLVWGLGKEFQNIYNLLLLNEECGYIDITAYVDNANRLQSLDGKKVISSEMLFRTVRWGEEYEYIIVTTEKYYEEIVEQGMRELEIPRRAFINGKIFRVPCFNWSRYLRIYESNISIIAEACYGGKLSHELGLPFNSPFVNVRVGNEQEDYTGLLQKLDYYMSVSPELINKGKYRTMEWGGYEGRIDFPKLWYGDIMLHGFHFKSQQDFFDVWEKRRKRFNNCNYLIMKILYTEKDVEEFIKLDCCNKLGIYYEDVNNENIVELKFEEKLREQYAYQFASYVFNSIGNGTFFESVDIFKLLCGEAGAKRKG